MRPAPPGPTPEMVEAGVSLFVDWQEGKLSDLYLSDQCGSYEILESPYQFLARAMWCAMQAVRQGQDSSDQKFRFKRSRRLKK